MAKKLLIIAVALGAMVMGGWVYHYQRTDFSTLDGQSHRWRDMQGQWVVVNYFARWCAPCLREVPELNLFHQQSLQKDIALFAISYDLLSDAELADIRDEFDMQFPLISGQGKPRILVPKPESLPATYLITPEGTIAGRLMGEQTAESLMASIEQLSKSKGL